MTVKLLTEHHLEFLSFKGGIHRLVRDYTCQNAAWLQITCCGLILYQCNSLAVVHSEAVILNMIKCLLLQPLCLIFDSDPF